MEILAEPVVSFVVERIGDWLIEEAKLLTGVRTQVMAIQTELGRMKCFLKDADAKHKEGATERNFVLEIEDIAYDVEDVVETFVLRVAFKRERREGNSQCYFLKSLACIFVERRDRHKVGSEIKAIRARISELSTSLQTYGIRSTEEGEGSSSSAHERKRLLRRTYSHVAEPDLIGLEDNVEKLVRHLVNEERKNDYYRTVLICGMGGLGKTSLAQNVYNDEDVKRHFDGVAWACISQDLQMHDVLQEILIKLVPERKDEIHNMRDNELVRLLREVQQNKKCFIVLDDIWTVEDWDILRSAFFIAVTSSSKLLVTTRNKEVALHVDPHGFLHEPRFLTEVESWELLQKKAFRRTDGSDIRHDKKLEELGRQMVGHCGGLPLAVVLLGGILVKKHTCQWEKVLGNINSYISRGTSIGQQRGGVSQVLALSYDELPYQLKRCFLYLGSFPQNCNLGTERLCQLWIAEGLVLSDDMAEEETLMDVGQRYICELAQRYMIRLGVQESWEENEYCRLHDRMRELCLSKVKEVNFLDLIDTRPGKETKLLDSTSSFSSNCKVRRLTILLSNSDNEDKWVPPAYLASQQHLRSLLFFQRFPVNGHVNCSTELFMPVSHLEGFKVLRVLQLDGVDVYPKDKDLVRAAIEKLIHLRYLSFRFCSLNELPSSIDNLRYLQTLDLRDNDKLVIPNVLWKIKSLTHLYLNRSTREERKWNRLDGLSKLEILENFNTTRFAFKDLFKLTNLTKLKVEILYEKRSNMMAIINYLSSSSTTNHRLRHLTIIIYYEFDAEEDLILLRGLLECHHLIELDIIGVISKFPEHHLFSPSLTHLEFCCCKLTQDPMPTLEKLPNLKGVRLLERSFVGVKMVCSENGFPQLKYLHLWGLFNLEEWRVDEGAMPNLIDLLFQECLRLKMVPDGLRFVNKLQDLHIRKMPEAFARRLQVVDGEEGTDHYKIQHVPFVHFYDKIRS